MVTHGWRTDRPLRQVVAEETGRFDFYQLVRLLLLAQAERTGQPVPSAALREARVLSQALRFRANLEQAFPAHEVKALREGAGVPQVETGNYALAGYLGALPEALAEQMYQRMRDGDQVLPRFLDLFNHQINVLRFQLKAAPRLGLNLQLPEQTPMAQMLLALIGLAEPAMLQQLQQPARAMLGVAGLLSNPRRSAPVLTMVLARFLGVPVSLQSLMGAWRERAEVDLCRLGHQSQALGVQSRLGRSNLLPTARLQLTIGPLPYGDFCKLLPARHGKPTTTHSQLVALLRFLLNRRQDAWLVLRLAAGEVPAARLTARTRQITPRGIYYGMRLGQTAWLHAAGEQPAVQLSAAATPEDRRAESMRLGQSAWLHRQQSERQARFLLPAFDGEAA